MSFFVQVIQSKPVYKIKKNHVVYFKTQSYVMS